MLVVYAITASPTVPPYRDSGELITSAYTLSVAHSPGYPLYMILGKFFITIGEIFGLSAAFSLNFLSCITGALTVFVLFFFVYDITKKIIPTVFGSLLSGFAYINWYLSTVSEMYSLNLLFIVVLLLMIKKRRYILFAFLSGLTLGNHLTSAFAVFVMGLYIIKVEGIKRIDFKRISVFFLLGLGVYIYLPIRAAGSAFINWGNPRTLKAFWDVVTRSAYGHKLDLISREVTLGQVFIPQIKVFFQSLVSHLTPVGILLGIFGFLKGIKIFKKKEDKYILIILALLFILTGPYFIYLAKMPVNPHALAIVEVNYMVGEMIAAVFAGLGLYFILILAKNKTTEFITYFGGAAVLVFCFINSYPKASKSGNYLAQDYAVNILNSVEKDSAVIMRRDHTMFSLWYKKDVQGLRKDVKVISKGLISAPWYRDKLKKDHPEIKWRNSYINDTEYIKWLCTDKMDDFPIYITSEAAGELKESFFSSFKLVPYGLVLKILPKNYSLDLGGILKRVEKKYVYTGKYTTTWYYDFFSKDFVRLYGDFYNGFGVEYLRNRKYGQAENMFERAIDFNPLFPDAHKNLAYIYFERKEYEKAEKMYIKSIQLLEDKIENFTRKEYFYQDLADMYNSLGAVYEKMYMKNKQNKYFNLSLNNYNKALKINPKFSQAYYNKAVLYWKKEEWEKVVKNLEYALKYDPENKNIMKYLTIAKRNLRKNK
ncbi:MAG: protein O-mannosyl-transferase family [Elusimicrobiota bacterium]